MSLASIEEARRGFDELGALGVKMTSNGAGIYLGDPTHLLYGSDTPYTPAFAIAQNKEGLADDPAIAPIVEDVFFNNAARLYGLSL